MPTHGSPAPRPGAIVRLLAAMLLAAAAAGCNAPADMAGKVRVAASASGPAGATLPVTFASRRPLVEVALVRPDGTERAAWAWVNMGAPAPVLSKALYRELGIDRGRDLEMRVGGITVGVRADAVTDGPGDLDGQDLFALLFAPRVVELVLPAGVLARFEVVLDPAARSLTLAPPGTLKPVGTPVPVRVNAATGVVTAEAEVAGGRVPLVLDAGAPYTWLRGATVAGWLRAHPGWPHAVGAVGASNLAMADLGLERAGTVIRVPEVRLGGVVLREVGALGTGPMLGRAGEAVLGEVFWDAWQRGAGEPVAGWLGGNVLGDFRLTIDHAAGLTYWQRQRPADPHDLDGVGLTLVRRDGGYAVGAVATRDGRRLVEDVEPGDALVAVDGMPVRGTSPDAVLAALHGRPGDAKALDLVRSGRRIRLSAPVTPF